MAQKRRSGENRPRREHTPGGSNRPDTPASDYLLDAAEENWPDIVAAYKRFEDKKPVVLYDLRERLIYVYPYAEFSRDLSEKSQLTLKDQYERAVRDNKIVVFVRDNERRKLVSFSMDSE
jgi:hypothetical protein